MINTTRNCTFCRLDTVELAPGETFRFPEEAASASFGFFGLGGGTTMLEGAVPNRMFTGLGEWCPNNAQLGWSNNDIGHANMLLEALPEGAKWICLSRNGSGEREIRHVKVENTETIPKDWAVIVATGSLSFESKVANQFAYISPRTSDFSAFGNADLLLLK